MVPHELVALGMEEDKEAGRVAEADQLGLSREKVDLHRPKGGYALS